MPGGMGGGMGGGLLGSLMKGAIGGMNRNFSEGQPQTADNIADVYDVTRWQRADGLDVVPTMVQTVRADWERKEAEKQARSPIKKLLSKFSRKKKSEPAVVSEPEPRQAGGTIIAPEMKKASQRINPAAERETVVQQEKVQKRQSKHYGKNYLGLSFQTEIDDFFTANPVNSAILAVDSLGMGALTLNQVTVMPETSQVIHQREVPQDIADQSASNDEQTGSLQNLITQRADVNYMNEFHKNREQQKYNVRIRD